MKKNRFWSMMVLAIGLFLLTACGGDDNGGDTGNRPTDPNNPDPNAIITFKDSRVAAICISNFDRNNDSQLSYAEAAAVTNLGTHFKGSSISCFDELKFFIGLSFITNSAFESCSSLTSIIIPNGVTSIGWYAFNNCSKLTSIVIPNGVTTIGDYTFIRCNSLTSITIPNSVTKIGNLVFAYCTDLASVIIGNHVGNVGDHVFNYCIGLKDIYCYTEKVPESSASTFRDLNVSSITLHVPATSLSLYKTDSYWKTFGNIVALKDSDPKPE